jgi:hypothetical protein
VGAIAAPSFAEGRLVAPFCWSPVCHDCDPPSAKLRDKGAARRLLQASINHSDVPPCGAGGRESHLSFEAYESTITSPALKAVAQHWRQARANNHLPSWKDISPSAIARQLAIIWFYEYDRATDTFVGRLAGNRIDRKFGHRFKGVPLQDLYNPESFQIVSARYKRVILEPKLYKGEGVSHIQNDRAGPGERITLPLASDHINPDGIIGATDYDTNDLPPMEAGSEIDRWFSL